MRREFISKATRNEFRELLTGYILRDIEMIFDAGALTPLEGYQPTVGGQRRGLVESYYANIDFSSPADVRKLLAAYEEIMESLQRAQASHPDEARSATINSLLRRMERDGFRYEGGRFLSEALNVAIVHAPSLVLLTEESIQEHVAKARQKIGSGDPAGAIANAYTLLEEFLKQLLRKTGTTFNESEGDIRALYKLVAAPLNLTPKNESLESHLKTILEGLQRQIDEIIAKAREPGSIVMKTVEIGEGGEVSLTGAALVSAPSVAEMIVTGAQPEIPGFVPEERSAFVFNSVAEGKTAEVTLEVIKRYERKLGSAEALRDKDVQQQIADEVRELVRPVQGMLEGVIEEPRIEKIVQTVAVTVADRTISIPQIVVLPKKQITFTFEDFDLANLEAVNVRPIEEGIVIHTLRTEARLYLARALDDPREARPEDYLVRYLIERNEIDYDAHAELLYKLAGQMVARVRSYLADDAEVENVLLRHGRQLADFTFAQMMNHYRETPLGEEDYEVTVTRGFMLLQAQPMNVAHGQRVRDFKQAISPLSETRKHVFGGFKKCCYPLQKFDTDPERRLAVIIDGDAGVEKWLKPGRNQFRIDYRSGESYEPDFVVETATKMLICEVKARNELDDPIVRAKAAAATKWCRTATAHAQGGSGKPWSYLLLPDDQIIGNATLDGLTGKFATS